MQQPLSVSGILPLCSGGSRLRSQLQLRAALALRYGCNRPTARTGGRPSTSARWHCVAVPALVFGCVRRFHGNGRSPRGGLFTCSSLAPPTICCREAGDQLLLRSRSRRCLGRFQCLLGDVADARYDAHARLARWPDERVKSPRQHGWVAPASADHRHDVATSSHRLTPRRAIS